MMETVHRQTVRSALRPSTHGAPYQRILTPIDGGPLSAEAVSQALALAEMTGACIFFLTVTEPYEPAASYAVTVNRNLADHQRHARLHAEHVLNPAVAAARDALLPAESLHVEDTEPYRAIIKAAEDNACDLIVMASHGRKGLAGILLGSQTIKVLTHCKIPVLVCRSTAAPTA